MYYVGCAEIYTILYVYQVKGRLEVRSRCKKKERDGRRAQEKQLASELVFRWVVLCVLIHYCKPFERTVTTERLEHNMLMGKGKLSVYQLIVQIAALVTTISRVITGVNQSLASGSNINTVKCRYQTGGQAYRGIRACCLSTDSLLHPSLNFNLSLSKTLAIRRQKGLYIHNKCNI